MAEHAYRGFLDSIGNESGCKLLAEEFYARVKANEDLRTLFPGKSLRCATEEFAAFLVQFLDGDSKQSQYRWWLSLSESHKRFHISERQRKAWLSVMDDAIKTKVEDPTTQTALKQFFSCASSYIVGEAEGTIDQPELAQRWDRQQALDLLVKSINEGHDSEAVDLVREYSFSDCVLVGILAQMINTGRPELGEFAMESVRANPALGRSKFNGRTLLHFASASACVPLVQLLLALGVEPDVTDSGGHSPMYRAAASQYPESGAIVIGELARAGANVNHSGGVSKSTPLHQAARFGRVATARALLALGASMTAKDIKGLTALDRAVNCRRHTVVELLEDWANSNR